MEAGIREQIAMGQDLLGRIQEAGEAADAPLRTRLATIAVAGLRRLEQEQDFNRILIKDLSLFPELLEIARTEEIARIHLAVADWLRSHVSTGSESRDWDAMATVIIGSISHYWLLRASSERIPPMWTRSDTSQPSSTWWWRAWKTPLTRPTSRR